MFFGGPVNLRKVKFLTKRDIERSKIICVFAKFLSSTKLITLGEVKAKAEQNEFIKRSAQIQELNNS